MTVYVISEIGDVDAAVKRMMLDMVNVVGFDTETTIKREDDKGLVSLIQIHTGTICTIYQIYRIWKQSGIFPSTLAKFLSNPQIIKVGVASEGDRQKIKKSYNIDVYGVIDIQYIARSIGNTHISLRDLGQRYVPEIQKEDKKSIWTNWDIDLPQKSIDYASTDALLSLLIYKRLISDVSDVHVFHVDVEDRQLHQWLSSMGYLHGRSTHSLINLVANNYHPWMKIYSLRQRLTLATGCIRRIIA